MYDTIDCHFGNSCPQILVYIQIYTIRNSILFWKINNEKKEVFIPTFKMIYYSVQSLDHVWLFATPWIAACQASLSIINSWSLLKLMPIKSMMPSSHLILCHPLLLLPPIPPIIRVFSNDSTLPMRWPKYWSFSFSISFFLLSLFLALVFPMNTQDWYPLGWTGWISLQSKGLSRVFSNTTVQRHQFFSTQLS